MRFLKKLRICCTDDITEKPLTTAEKLAVLDLKDFDPLYLYKLQVREIKYLMSRIDVKYCASSSVYATYRGELIRRQQLSTARTVAPSPILTPEDKKHMHDI